MNKPLNQQLQRFWEQLSLLLSNCQPAGNLTTRKWGTLCSIQSSATTEFCSIHLHSFTLHPLFQSQDVFKWSRVAANCRERRVNSASRRLTKVEDCPGSCFSAWSCGYSWCVRNCSGFGCDSHHKWQKYEWGRNEQRSEDSRWQWRERGQLQLLCTLFGQSSVFSFSCDSCRGMKTQLFLYIIMSCVCALLQNGFVRNRRIPSNARPADTQRKFNSVLAHNKNPTSNLLKETHVQRM